MKCVPNKWPSTKSTPNQPNTMEAWFAQLKVLATSMASSTVAHLKSNVHISAMPQDKKDTSSHGSNS